MGKSKRYDFENLEWQQFEELSFKCLQQLISPSVEFIESGNDKGRDIVYTGVTSYFDETTQKSEYLFQVKHKTGTNGFNGLKSDLKKELEKVFVKNKLKYDYYCLVTNLTISGDQYDMLRKIFDDFLTRESLVGEIDFKRISYRNLESCIDDDNQHSIKFLFPSIVKNADFKNLLDQLIERKGINISSGWKQVFNKNRPRFIYTSIYHESDKKLQERSILLLSGPPKSGKTFNAEALMLNMAGSKSFTPFKIDNILEFDNIYDKSKRQIFLFDDAFGKYDLEFNRADYFDRKLEYIFELIDEDHKCIFTSREHIHRAFINYTDQQIGILINKIVVDVSKLSLGEKECIFDRYYFLSQGLKHSIGPQELSDIIYHPNFSPETIRSFFDTSDSFELTKFKEHLNSPDKYLLKIFDNLPQEKRIILLSLLFSLNDDEVTIAYAFDNICVDLQQTPLIRIKTELMVMEDSIVKCNGDKYTFYHPSMSSFFISYLSEDVSTYRSLLFKNLNITLLSLVEFQPKFGGSKKIKIDELDVENLTAGFKRLISNPSASIYDINGLLGWMNNADVLVNFKVLLKEKFRSFKNEIKEELNKIKLSRILAEDILNVSIFLRNVNLLFDSRSVQVLNEDDFKKLIDTHKSKPNFWLLVFRSTPFLTEDFIYNNVGKDWLNHFYISLRDEINSLGEELFGNAYPKFEEVQRYKKLMEENKSKEAQSIKKKKRSDYKLKTNKNWYPRYVICKEKVTLLKVSQPYGIKIHSRLESNFGHLQMLEDHQLRRYLYNKGRRWW